MAIDRNVGHSALRGGHRGEVIDPTHMGYDGARQVWNGMIDRVGRDETAFDHRDAAFNMAIISRWTSPDEAEANTAWTRDLSAAMKPFARGAYVNYLGVGDASDRVRAAYGDAKYNRLADLKARFDPENLFRFNQNITPRAR